MSIFADKKGRIIFGVILVVVLIAALVAYQITGSMGIEDRYNAAVGLPASTEEGGGTFLGFSAEGNPILYGIVLVLLAVVCYAAYRRYKI